MLRVKMMAEFMAKCAEEGSERGDLSLHRSAHPYANGHIFNVVVTEEFAGPVFSNVQRACGKHTDGATRNHIKVRCCIEEFVTETAYAGASAAFHGCFDGFRLRDPFSGKCSVRMRSLSLNAASPALRGGAAVNMSA